MARTEIKMLKDEDDVWDICFDENGDFLNEDSFDTDIEMSLFTDTRAESSQISNPVRRRGWLGDEFSTLVGFKIGSLLWLLEQARNTIATQNDAISYVEDCLSWLRQKGYVDLIQVTASRNLIDNALVVTAKIFVENDNVKSFTFDLFELSKYAGNANVAKCFVSTSLVDPTFAPEEEIAPVGDIVVGDGFIG